MVCEENSGCAGRQRARRRSARARRVSVASGVIASRCTSNWPARSRSTANSA